MNFLTRDLRGLFEVLLSYVKLSLECLKDMTATTSGYGLTMYDLTLLYRRSR